MISNVARTQRSLLSRWMSVQLLPLQHRNTLNCRFLFSKRLASTAIFKRELEICESDIMDILNKYPSLGSATDKTVEETAKYLKSLCTSTANSFSNEVLKAPFILSTPVGKLINNGLILSECGFKHVGIRELQLFLPFTRKRLAVLKAHGYIPNDVSVIAQILSKVPGMSGEVAKEIQENIGMRCENHETIENIYQHVLLHYLCWRLKTDASTIIDIADTYQRLKNRSITLIEETVNIMDKLELTRDFILRNGFLLHAYPQSVKTMMKEVPILAGMPLSQAIAMCPKIMMHNYKLLQEMQKMLYSYGIRDEAIKRCMKIFTISVETARARIESLLNDSFTGCLIGHPRILIMVVYNRLAQQRLETLRDIDLRCYSLQLISCASNSKFEKFTSNREDRTNGYDVIFFLSYVLNCDKRELRTILNFHPNWHHIPLSPIYTNLTLLASRGFTTDLIRHSVHVLLYPPDQVEKVLDSLVYDRPKDAVDWSHKLYVRNIYHETFTSKFEEIDSDSVLSKSKVDDDLKTVYTNETIEAESTVVEWNLVLPMCLYVLEKPYHFTGAGVWASDKNEQEITSVSY